MDLKDKTLWLFDVDSTLIRDVEDPEPFQDAIKLWNALLDKGKTVAALTNTGRLSARQVHSIVSHAGFKLDLTKTFTAGAAAAAYVTNRMPGARCYVISEGGALEDFVARGLDVTNNPPVDFVAIAADRGMTYTQMNFATKMVKNGAHLICISSSKNYPGVYLGHEDMYIGERSITVAIEHATGVEAVIVAKPMPEIVIGWSSISTNQSVPPPWSTTVIVDVMFSSKKSFAWVAMPSMLSESVAFTVTL